MTIRVAFFSVVPSPYQRDLFAALAAHPAIELRVFYLEAAAPDSPWPEKPLGLYERVLPGFWLSLNGARFHLNWGMPKLAQFNVVVLNTLMSTVAQWIMRSSRKPWIFWGERLGRGGALHRWLTAPLHRATAIAAIGTFAERDYRERFPEPRHFCVPYFCDLAPFAAAPRRERADGKVVFLFCGQMIARKGLDVLLEAFATLETRAHLLLVGREAELPATLPERCVYAGFQPPAELPRFFSQADVFVLPSRYDGWGVVVNQAIGAGMPVICSDMVGAGFDLVQDEVNGLKFRAGDAASLAEKMRRFLDEPALVEQWGAASRAEAREWTPECGAARWVAVLEAMLAK